MFFFLFFLDLFLALACWCGVTVHRPVLVFCASLMLPISPLTLCLTLITRRFCFVVSHMSSVLLTGHSKDCHWTCLKVTLELVQEKKQSIFLELTDITTWFLQNQFDSLSVSQYLLCCGAVLPVPHPLVLLCFFVRQQLICLYCRWSRGVVCECWCVFLKVEKLFKQVSDHVLLGICNLMLG